ncbi:MAG: hypothetical protein R2702_19545 [Acidimicrobiales bacterium]
MVVSGVAGATGLVVGQIAKLKGAGEGGRHRRRAQRQIVEELGF